MAGRLLIQGSVLVGFAEFFDKAWGDPKTPRPYPKVTPARIGASLLPFACPHCGAESEDAVNKRRDGYRDPQRGFSWCPVCSLRYIVVYEGAPLVDKLEPGAKSAPALVDRGDGPKLLRVADSGLNDLGVVT